MKPVKWSLHHFILFFLVQSCLSVDTISTHKPFKDGDVLVSEEKTYAFGFFSPGNSKLRYVGIWYNQVSVQTVVWVANRDNPINDTSGEVRINSQGNLVAYGSNATFSVWSTNISDSNSSSSVAQIYDSGNLVLFDNFTRDVLWQSFDYPTSCVLPSMKLGLTRKTNLNRFPISWKSTDDPGTGNFSCRLNTTGFPQLILYKGSDPLWRGGVWTGKRWSGVPEMTRNFIFNITYVNSQDENYIMYDLTDKSVLSRLMVHETGIIARSTWNNRDHKWIEFWSAPKEQCDYYGNCGPNSNCNPYELDKFVCTCLPGFEPKMPRDWQLRDGSAGCVRISKESTCGNGEGFVMLAHVKVPDTSNTHVHMNLGLKECGQICLINCSCVAYATAYYEANGGRGCLTWHGNLVDTRTFSGFGQDFYVRVDAVELARWRKKESSGKKWIVAILVLSLVAILSLAVGCILWSKRRKRRAKAKNYLQYSLDEEELDETISKGDLPFFDLRTIAKATDNFSSENKLGQGGFGSVYKGVLHNGMEIAIKRLSRYSGQGTEEFKNEMVLIAKLQHKNLVRILGYCVEGEEKMLIYEYLANKSLDTFLFDESKKSELDWGKRFEIICGVARGMLYLHQDSRLRIIHRDLKPSNVLLDAEMIPKISDFGLARIVGGDQIEANTKRVVGTYGYMSPEYAMEGLFSTKSDVFSFGVLLLEIITGKKNTSYYNENPSLNLAGHVWDLWTEGNALEIVDKALDLWTEGNALEIVDKALDHISYATNEILRCIKIGLLCLQESTSERPTMYEVVFMLGNNTTELRSPKQPAFSVKRPNHDDNIWSSEGAGSSVNDITLSTVLAR